MPGTVYCTPDVACSTCILPCRAVRCRATCAEVHGYPSLLSASCGSSSSKISSAVDASPECDRLSATSSASAGESTCEERENLSNEIWPLASVSATSNCGHIVRSQVLTLV